MAFRRPWRWLVVVAVLCLPFTQVYAEQKTVVIQYTEPVEDEEDLQFCIAILSIDGAEQSPVEVAAAPAGGVERTVNIPVDVDRANPVRFDAKVACKDNAGKLGAFAQADPYTLPADAAPGQPIILSITVQDQ